MQHPSSGRRYSVPWFRLLYKIHKAELGFRGLTGNHTWVTRPFALLLAFLLLSYVIATSTYVRDSDQFVAELRSVKVLPHYLLVTLDVVRLYPTIPHRLCVRLLSDYLNSKGCTYTAFLMAILDVVLTENYCFFAGYYWKQFLGFATGVACGSEVANLFLFALLEPVFSDPRFMNYLIYNKRYIDDCVLIWSGSTELLRVMIAELNACCDEINLTFEISDSSLVFLDVYAYKGPGWQRTGFLDTEVYQKVMNQYLYTPPTSEHPRHTPFGLIYGECLRYIKKSSSFESYVKIAVLFYQRLRARGFSLALLAAAFSKAPSYDIRDDLLAKALAPPSLIDSNSLVLVFSAVFSRSKIAAGLPRAIFLNQEMLMQIPEFPPARLLNAWRVSSKIGGRLLTFRYPSLRDEGAFIRPAL